MALTKKLVVTTCKSFTEGGANEFYVAEAQNTLRFLPGDRPTINDLRACLDEGIAVTVKRKGVR